MNDSDTISMDWAEGHKETTVWLWTDSTKPVTFTLPAETWETVKGRADDHGVTIPEVVTSLIRQEVEEGGHYLGG